MPEPPINENDFTRTSDGSPRDLNVPVDRLGDFELLREVGRGGMGVVYEARQISLNRRVALKVLPPGLGLTQQAITRFEREARAAAKLHHTNIVPVHATGEDAGCHYYAMELIEGKSLSDLIEELREDPDHASLQSTASGESKEGPGSSSGTLSDSSATTRGRFDTVAKLLADVAEGLDYAHGRGIIHRDIKPANLMMSADGRLCVTDFGLARIAQEPGMTVSGSFLGTPAYMSPEQIAAGRIGVDHRSDIYSLGAVLYEMLTLQRAFPGEARDKVLTGIMTKEPTAPRKVNPRIPLDLETICQKAMEKDADRRYQSAGELAHDLRQFLAHGLISARRAGPARRAVKLVQRHPVVSIAVIAIVLIGALGGVLWRTSRQRAQETLQALIRDAQHELSQGTYRVALAKADRALAIDDDSTEARVVRARALMELWRAPEAVREAQTLLEANPDDWLGHAILIQAARSEGSTYTGDVEVHREAVERLAPETAEAYVIRAMLADDSLEALPLLDKAVEMDPGNVRALEERADTHSDLLDFQAALADVERMITARPKSARGRLHKAGILFGMHELGQAFVEAQKALEFDPEDAVVHFALAGGYREMGDDETARTHLDRAIELDPLNTAYLEQRAWRLKAARKFDEALTVADEIERLDPEALQVQSIRLWIYVDTGDRKKVDETLARIEARAEEMGNPGHIRWAYVLLRDVAIRDEDYPRALEAQNALIANSDDVVRPWSAYLSRAEIHRLLGDEEAAHADCLTAAHMELIRARGYADRAWRIHQECALDEEGLRDAERAVEMAPRWADAYGYRALLRLVNGDVQGTMADLDNAIELAPSILVPRSNRWILRARLGRFEEALEDADALIRLAPESTAGHTARTEVLILLGRLDEAIEAQERVVIEAGQRNERARISLASLRSELPGTCDDVARELDEIRAVDPEGLKDAFTYVQLYRLYGRCPEHFDLEGSFAAAKRNLDRDPSSEADQGVYGLALYRAGRYREALDPLEKASIKYIGMPRADFPRAMVLWELGRRGEARAVYDKAAGWMSRSGCAAPELLRLQREAAELMGSS